MIHTTLDPKDAKNLLDFAIKIHAETRYNKEPLNITSFCSFFDLLIEFPDRYFMCYSTDESKVTGMFFGQITIEYFSGKKTASDLGMFVHPDFRGSSLFIRMYKLFEEWAKQNNAYKIILYHSTGIEPEKTKRLFTKMNFTEYGSIFDKEL